MVPFQYCPFPFSGNCSGRIIENVFAFASCHRRTNTFPAVNDVRLLFVGILQPALFQISHSRINTDIGICIGQYTVYIFYCLINDVLRIRIDNYELLLALYALQFVCVYTGRGIVTGNATSMIHRRKWQFNTLIIGCGPKAIKQMRELEEPRQSLGYHIVGFIRVNHETPAPEAEGRTYPIKQLSSLCKQMNIQELVVAPEENDLAELHKLINTLYPLNLPIKLGTDEFNIISSRVRLTNIYGAPLIDMSNCAISEGEKNMKRVIDIFVSFIALILLSPLFLLLAILIKKRLERSYILQTRAHRLQAQTVQNLQISNDESPCRERNPFVIGRKRQAGY